MEKILLKRIGCILSILSILIFALLSGIIFFTERDIAIHNLDEINGQVENLYNKSKLNIEVTKNIFEEDYLNRAYAVDFMLNNNPEENYTTSTLKKIKNLMEVESIHIIDNSGEIVISSEEESIGLNLKDHPEAEAFAKLIDSTDAKANVVQLDGVSITRKEPKTYIGVKSSLEKYSIIQIGLDASTFDNLIKQNSISSILKNMPTSNDTAIFVIDRNSGNIDAITQNNLDKLNFGENNGEDYISILNKYNEGKLVKINGSLKLIKTQNIDDKIIGVFVDANTLFRSVLLQIVCLFIGILIILVCIFMIFRYYLKRYVLNDLSTIESTIKEIMAGNKDVKFETEHNTEFRYITAMLNEWREVYNINQKECRE